MALPYRTCLTADDLIRVAGALGDKIQHRPSGNIRIGTSGRRTGDGLVFVYNPESGQYRIRGGQRQRIHPNLFRAGGVWTKADVQPLLDAAASSVARAATKVGKGVAKAAPAPKPAAAAAAPVPKASTVKPTKRKQSYHVMRLDGIETEHGRFTEHPRAYVLVCAYPHSEECGAAIAVVAKPNGESAWRALTPREIRWYNNDQTASALGVQLMDAPTRERTGREFGYDMKVWACKEAMVTHGAARCGPYGHCCDTCEDGFGRNGDALAMTIQTEHGHDPTAVLFLGEKHERAGVDLPRDVRTLMRSLVAMHKLTC